MAILEKEEILIVAAGNIPEEIKQIPQFILWRAEWNEKREQFDKIPYQIDGKRASSTDPLTWNTFEIIFDVYENSNEYDGVGFVLTDLDLFSVVDIDGLESIDELDELTQEIVNMSYAEVSPSGKGIHCWFKYEHNKQRHKNKSAETGFELYSTMRFMTITGESLNNLPVNEGGQQLDKFLDKVLKRKQVQTSIIQRNENFGRAALTEEEIILVACKNPKTGERFKSFLSGGWESKYNNDFSSADLAFLNDLAFWCNCDYQIIDSIYRKSSLMRDKWDRPQNGTTYGNEQIMKAINECTNTFNPPKGDEGNSKGSWWRSNGNGTISFLHQVLAKEVLKKYNIVRYPSPHSDLFYYNPKKGVYEQDKSGRQINGIIRSFDEDLKSGQIREVYNFIQDTSPVIKKVNENYIALENGLLNLKNFQLEKFNYKIFVLQKIGVKYNPNAFDEFIESTLNKVTKGHKPSITNIKEMFACVLYPGLLVPKMFYLYGRSAHNGKSSVLNMIHYTFNKDGGSISAVPPQKLASNTFAGASLYGKLANIVDDQPDQVIEDSGTLKTIITGGYIEIERKGKDSETVKMSTVMITASNFFPNFRESGAQINRRLHIIPFEHNFTLDKECLSDGESLELISSDSAREYVLKLAVDALKVMLGNSNSEKITVNDKSLEAAKAFAEHNDPMADYFFEHNEEYFEDMPGTRVLTEYEEWCKANRVPALETKRFKEVVCGRYDMEWKLKRIVINGDSKPVKGFKNKK